MLYLYSGTDREKARAAMDAAVKKASKKNMRIVRINDANVPADLAAALQGGGMFAEQRIIILDGVLASEEMTPLVMDSLPPMKASEEPFFILADKLDAATRKQIEKYAETSEKFDAVKQKEASSIFAIANALRRGDRKALWISYQRELANDAAPEAIHGVLF